VIVLITKPQSGECTAITHNLERAGTK